MTDQIMAFLSGFDVQTIISMMLLLWIMNGNLKRDIKTSLDKLDIDLRQMDRDFKSMNTRISRTEGTVYGKDIYNIIKED